MKESRTCTDCVREDCHGCDIANKSRINGVIRGINLKEEYEKGKHLTKTHDMINAAKELDDEKEEFISKYANTPINPKHYNDPGSDVIKFCMDNNLDFMQGNIVKYIVRYKQKNGIEDLKKTAEYLRRLIEREESKTI